MQAGRLTGKVAEATVFQEPAGTVVAKMWMVMPCDVGGLGTAIAEPMQGSPLPGSKAATENEA